MEKITSENYDKEYPLITNNELLEEKGFGSGIPNEEYFKLKNRYKSFLDSYIKEKLPLELIDTNKRRRYGLLPNNIYYGTFLYLFKK